MSRAKVTTHQSPQLGLGTVQFGLPYGATNRTGQVASDEARDILSAAVKAGITVFDTAAAYGSSESVLGSHADVISGAHIVTKIAPIGTHRVTESDLRGVRESFEKSLAALQRKSVYGLLAHRAGDLLSVDGDRLWKTMESLRESGVVQKIGASVYTGNELDQLMDRFPLSLVQVPINPLDQRLIHSGHLERLTERGVEVHVRSLFLQGTLLAKHEETTTIPKHLAASIRQWQQFLSDHQSTPLEGALSFARSLAGVGTVLVGVTSLAELLELLSAWTQANHQLDFSSLACTDETVLNPALWPAT